jgi:hypothetical protein
LYEKKNSREPNLMKRREKKSFYIWERNLISIFLDYSSNLWDGDSEKSISFSVLTGSGFEEA